MDIGALWNNFNWEKLLEKVRTENIVQFMTGKDPVEVFKDPYFAGGAIVLCLLLYFFHFRKTLVLLLGLVALWYDFVHFMPKSEIFTLHELFSFTSICVAVLGIWIYFFLIRGD